jgi:cation transport ATPase
LLLIFIADKYRRASAKTVSTIMDNPTAETAEYAEYAELIGQDMQHQQKPQKLQQLQDKKNMFKNKKRGRPTKEEAAKKKQQQQQRDDGHDEIDRCELTAHSLEAEERTDEKKLTIRMMRMMLLMIETSTLMMFMMLLLMLLHWSRLLLTSHKPVMRPSQKAPKSPDTQLKKRCAILLENVPVPRRMRKKEERSFAMK